MDPSGSKNFQVRIQNIKIFLQPYYFLMVDHFFRQGMPEYKMGSFDKPNEYDADVETWPNLHLNCSLKHSLICLASDKVTQKTIACTGDLEYQFQREKIREIKKSIASKYSEMSAFADEEEQNRPIGMPFLYMRLQIFELCPFLCNYEDLELGDFAAIKKRQIVSPFDLAYFYAKYLELRPGNMSFILFEKTEINSGKNVIKVSYNDFVLLSDIFARFNESYSKFNEFYEQFLASKPALVRRTTTVV